MTIATRFSHADPTPARAAMWADDFHTVLTQLGRHCARSETRAQLRAYLTGLLSPIERKNGWQLAEQAGDATPYAMQYLLGRALWDADAARDDLQGYVRTQLADPAGVLVIDETSFLKKWTHSVGVGVQYSGIAGKLENSQVGVFLAYVSPRGQTLYDRALYLPRDWADDPARRAQAGVPDGVRFATKPQLATELVLRALDSGLPVAWVTGDEVYGGDYRLRVALEEREVPYALTVKASQFLWQDLRQRQARTLVAAAPAAAWERLSCGDGSKGPRRYDWLRIPIHHPHGDRWQRWLVARRGLAAPEDPRSIAYVLAFAPAERRLATLARVIGERWGIERAIKIIQGARLPLAVPCRQLPATRRLQDGFQSIDTLGHVGYLQRLEGHACQGADHGGRTRVHLTGTHVAYGCVQHGEHIAGASMRATAGGNATIRLSSKRARRAVTLLTVMPAKPSAG